MKKTALRAVKNDSTGRDILDCIRKIVQELRVASRQAESRIGLSGAQLFVLQKLGDGEAMSLTELARRTLTHQSSVSVVVQRLVERGLVQRLRSEADARQLELSITPAGRKTLKNAPGAAQERLIGAIQQMKPGERRKLADLLGALVEQMGIEQRSATMLFEDGNGRNR